MNEVNTPKVSVVMSVYREPVEWLRQSIDSILNQTFRDFEYIIICDSPDYNDGITLLKEYASKDERIRLIFNESNIGLTKSLNKGLKIARGKYIARMDADDISKSTRFEKQISYLDSHSECIVCGTRVKYFGDIKWWKHPKSDWIRTEDEKNKGRLIIGSCFAHPSIIMRRLSPPQFYNENIRRSQDYDMWTRIAELGQFHNIPDELLLYRVSPSQISSSSFNQYASNIRNNYLISIYKKCGIVIPDVEFQLTPDFLLEKMDTVKHNQMITECERNNIIQLTYFVQSENRWGLFVRSLFWGDFFRFPFLDEIRFILIVLGLRESMKL